MSADNPPLPSPWDTRRTPGECPPQAVPSPVRRLPKGRPSLPNTEADAERICRKSTDNNRTCAIPGANRMCQVSNLDMNRIRQVPIADIQANNACRVTYANIDANRMRRLPNSDIDTSRIRGVPNAGTDANRLPQVPNADIHANNTYRVPYANIDANNMCQLPNADIDANRICGVPNADTDANRLPQVPNANNTYRVSYANIDANKMCQLPNADIDWIPNTDKVANRMFRVPNLDANRTCQVPNTEVDANNIFRVSDADTDNRKEALQKQVVFYYKKSFLLYQIIFIKTINLMGRENMMLRHKLGQQHYD
jgi:hypothetical protein